MGVSVTKKKDVKSPGRKEAAHPKYLDMIVATIRAAKDERRKGVSKSALLKRIKETYDVGTNAKFTNTQLYMALKRGLAKAVLKMAKEGGKGSGHFKLIDSAAYETKTKAKKNSASSKAKKSKRVSIDTNIKVAKKPGKKVSKVVVKAPKTKAKVAKSRGKK